jgi:hypothetical protein
VILYREPEEILKGAFVEAGCALAAGTPVFAIGCGEFTFTNHRLVTNVASVGTALEAIRALPLPVPASPWRSMESAPKDGTAIWLVVDGHPYIGFCEPADELHEEDRWFVKSTFVRRGTAGDRRATPTTDDVYCCYGFDVKPTAWTDLPPPPAPPPLKADEEK